MRLILLILPLLLAACRAPDPADGSQPVRGPYVGGAGGVNFR
jgi:hypothetical protein